MKIGTFDVLNLAFPGITFHNDQSCTHEEYAAKKSWIVTQLGRMGAHIVGFQGIWNEAALEGIAAEVGYDHVVVPGADSREGVLRSGPYVGLASRFPIVSVRSIVAFPVGVGSFGCPVLKARIRISRASFVTVFVVQLTHRAREAAAIRALVRETITGSADPVVVLGDLNDAVNAVTTERVTWRTPRKEPIWDRLLYSAWELHARPANGNLDHILLCERFVSVNPNRVGEVVDLRFFDEPLVTDRRPEGEHGQLVAEIRMG